MNYQWVSCWKWMLSGALARNGETFGDVQCCTISEGELWRMFDRGFGGTEGEPFRAWTARRVYFAHEYDGAEGVESVSRHPEFVEVAHV